MSPIPPNSLSGPSLIDRLTSNNLAFSAMNVSSTNLQAISSFQEDLRGYVSGSAADGVQRPPHLHREPEVSQLQPTDAAVWAYLHLATR